jgi:hypothetical protein
VALLQHKCTTVTYAALSRVSPPGVIVMLRVADFVIARELRVECDPFYGNNNLPDISARSPYVRQRRQPARTPAAAVEPGEEEPRSKVPWQRQPMQHQVPDRWAKSWIMSPYRCCCGSVLSVP